MNNDSLVDHVMEHVVANLKRRSARMAEVTYPVLKNFYEEHGDKVERIAIPVTDGRLGYNVVTNLKEAVETEGKSIAKAFQKTILLYTIDEAWERHLLAMDELQNAVRNVSYENKDPLVIFKMEAYELFRSMVIEMNQKASEIIMRGHINIAPQQQDESDKKVEVQEQHDDPRAANRRRYQEQKDDYEAQQQSRYEAGQAASRQPQKKQPYIAEQRIGRNDPCPCGSGKKFKNCHGQNL